MTPYYQESGITIYNADCRDVVPELHAVQAVFADPPFNVGKRYGKATDDNRDDYYEWCESWVGPCFSALADDGTFYLMTITRHLAALFPMMETRGHFINQIIWRHQVGACDKRRFWPNYQPILMYGKTENYQFFQEAETDFSGKVRFGAYTTEPKGRLKDTWEDIPMVFSGAIHHREAILTPGTLNKAHPCQMPTALARRCMRFSCPPNGTILDPFMGSGATLDAAKATGYQAIGIEIEERYCEIAANRLRQEVLAFG